jgi:ribosome recycling factor
LAIVVIEEVRAMDVDEAMLVCEEHIEKTLEYLRNEMRSIRTGRASTGMIEHVKADVYGSPTELKNIAAMSIPEPSQILIKPFDPSTVQAIVKGIEKADLGFNPISDGKVIRVPVPALSGDRRKQLAAQVKQMGEQAKIGIRNARRDANKQIDEAQKNKSNSISEDQAATAKDEVQASIKKSETIVDELVLAKTNEIMQI